VGPKYTSDKAGPDNHIHSVRNATDGEQMSDLRFTDVVIESNSMIGPSGKSHTAVCRTCSTKHKATSDEYIGRATDSGKVLRYMAEMRAWNCHHEGGVPLDGFPDKPSTSRIAFDN
jgi:hypothetical protein